MTLLNELNQKANDVGHTKFTVSVLSDPHVKTILSHISKETGESIADIEKKIKDKIDEFETMKNKAPILYHTIALNVVEGEVFNALKNVPVKGAPKFNTILFTKLIRMIKQEHKSLFPMKNFANHETISNPRIILIPSDDAAVMKKFSSVDTACATPNGEFCFNKDFMQELLNFAHLKNLKPKGKKYEANKGEIPNEYSYIEFLIMHEFMHYTYADFHYGKVYKADPTIANWVGDFRTNYDLVKNNHDQIPIGLFNDLINLDRQKDWKEMYDVVKAEFDKLNDKEKQDAKDQLGDLENGEHGDPSDEDGEPGKDDKPSKDGKPGEGEGPTKEDAEKSEKQARAKGDKGEESGKEDEQTSKPAKSNASSPGGPGGKGSNGSQEIDYTKYRPSMSWKALLAKLVRTSTEEETSYQKVHRRNITRVHTAAQTGKSAMKPGEMDQESNLLKLCIVVDSSGSMSSVIGQVYANIDSLLKTHSKEVKLGFVLVKFSSDHKMYQCITSGKGSYREIKSINDKSTSFETGDLKKLFSDHFGSSTNFDSALTADLDVFIKDDYNVLIISDTDIIASSNKEEFLKFFKRSNGKVYLIAGDKHDYASIIGALKNVSANITHM